MCLCGVFLNPAYGPALSYPADIFKKSSHMHQAASSRKLGASRPGSLQRSIILQDCSLVQVRTGLQYRLGSCSLCLLDFGPEGRWTCSAEMAFCAGDTNSLDHGVATPLEVYQGLVAEGYQLSYRRLPLSRERTPVAADLDALNTQLMVQPEGNNLDRKGFLKLSPGPALRH